MSKPIKVSDEDWAKLRAMQAGGETFADAVHRLLAIQEGVRQFIAETESMPEYRRYKLIHLEKNAEENHVSTL